MLPSLLLQQLNIDMSTGISLAVLLAILTAAVKISMMFARIEAKLDLQKNVPSRLRHIENHLLSAEADVNNLFGALRAAAKDPAMLESLTRRATFKPLDLDE